MQLACGQCVCPCWAGGITGTGVQFDNVFSIEIPQDKFMSQRQTRLSDLGKYGYKSLDATILLLTSTGTDYVVVDVGQSVKTAKMGVGKIKGRLLCG